MVFDCLGFGVGDGRVVCDAGQKGFRSMQQ
jgi:hypothetical protein